MLASALHFVPVQLSNLNTKEEKSPFSHPSHMIIYFVCPDSCVWSSDVRVLGFELTIPLVRQML